MKDEVQEQEMYEYWLARLAGISAGRKMQLRAQFHTAKELYHAGFFLHDLLKPKEQQALKKAQHEPLTELAWQWDNLQKKGIRFVPFFAPEYPPSLTQIQDPPYALYVKGSLPDPDRPAVALVGARSCTPYGEKMALLFGEALAAAGVQVISGMARGIDSAGHRGALNGSRQAGDRPGGEDPATFAILGGGVDVCYPRENIGLYMDLADRGGLLSEQLMGSPPKAANFPARNRIISGLSEVVLVLEARKKSGSLITADLALEQGKDVYALPGPVTSPLSEGCHQLIRQGAGILLSPEDLLEEMGLRKKYGPGEKTTGWPREEKENSDKSEKILASPKNLVYSFLDFSPKGIQELAEKSALAPEVLLGELVELELEGKVEEVSKNFYIRTC